jgi:hypothetical protein
MNVSLWNCKYIILDTPWLRDELGNSKSVETLTPVILTVWREVYSVGDYHVYENPNTMVYRVEGIVTDRTGTPIADAWVTCFNSITRVEYGSHTGSDGRYMFLAPSGTYILDVWPPTGTRLMHYRDPHFQVSSNVLNSLRLQLGVFVSGVVYASDGYTPVANVSVSLHDDLNKRDFGAYTDSRGAYTILAPLGTYIFDIWPQQGSHLLHYQERNLTLTEDVTRTIVLRSGFIVTGYVFAPDHVTSVPGSWVSLYNPDSKEVFGSYTDLNGYYTFLAPPGTYILDVWTKEGSHLLHYQEKNLTLTEDLTRTIVLRSGFILEGHVYAPDKSTPIPRCWVSLYDPKTKEVFGSWTDPSGYYSILAPSGTYILDVWPPADSYYQHLSLSSITIQSDTYLNLNLSAS